MMKFLVLTCLLHAASAAVVTIDTQSVLYTVNEKFLSFCMDQGLLGLKPKFHTFDFNSPQVRTLLRGLSPAFLRFGGSPADWSMFTEADPAFLTTLSTNPVYTSYSKKDIDGFVEMTSNCSLHLLFDLNLQKRQGKIWDPTDAIALLEYFKEKGYGANVDFELGNEPNEYYTGERNMIDVSGSRIGSDFLVLRKVLDQYDEVRSSTLVGADIVGEGPHSTGMFKDFVNVAGKTIDALTFHHYYFHGPTSPVSSYVDVNNFANLEQNINLVRNSIRNTTAPDVEIWIGETSDSWGGGTYNVSTRYISGFLWLDKLGLSAKMNIGVVMRQTFFYGNYSMIQPDFFPNPDYWLSYVHKQLVGTRVLNVSVIPDTLFWPHSKLHTDFSKNIRVYSHCTKTSDQYKAGAVTVFALNMKNDTSETLTFKGDLAWQKVHVYMLTPGDSQDLLSRYVNLNGKRLELVSETQLPKLIPNVQQASVGVSIPPLRFGFFVFPDANVKICQ